MRPTLFSINVTALKGVYDAFNLDDPRVNVSRNMDTKTALTMAPPAGRGRGN